jgi:hypothetical protein
MLVIVLFGLFFSTIANSQDWGFQPVLRVGGEVDDNARLDFRTDSEIELEGLLVDASAGITFNSPRTEFDFTPRVLIRSYSDEPDFDSDDIFLTSRYKFATQNSELGFRVAFDEQQVRNAEREDADLDVEDPDDITDNASGRVGVRGERSKWRIVPQWKYNFTDISAISVEVDHFDVSYDDVFAGILTDYRDTRLNATFRRAFSSTTTGLLVGSGRSFVSDDNIENEIDGYGAMAGFDHALSNTTSILALIGFETTDIDSLDDNTEVVGELVFRRRLETINLLAQYRRRVNASGSGQLSIRDSISLNATRRLSEKISAGLGVRAYESDPLGRVGVFVQPSRYVQLRARFTWYFMQALSAEVDYRYTVLDRGAIVGESANSNQVVVWFSYHPNTRPR